MYVLNYVHLCQIGFQEKESLSSLILPKIHSSMLVDIPARPRIHLTAEMNFSSDFFIDIVYFNAFL